MVRTVIPPHHQHHEDNDAEDIATDTDTYPHRGFFSDRNFILRKLGCCDVYSCEWSEMYCENVVETEGKSAEHKPNNYRLKHSETEQRRRSKINERWISFVLISCKFFWLSYILMLFCDIILNFVTFVIPICFVSECCHIIVNCYCIILKYS